jgi:thioredoxin 1
MDLTNKNFQDTLKSNKVVMVDFWAAWCGPCKALTPIIKELEEEFSDKAVVAKVNVDNEPQIAAALSIRAMPTIIFFKDGVEIERLVGMSSKSTYSNKINYYLN